MEETKARWRKVRRQRQRRRRRRTCMSSPVCRWKIMWAKHKSQILEVKTIMTMMMMI